MDFLPNMEQVTGAWDSVATSVLAFEAPVPDSALLAGFLVAIAAQRIAHRRTFARVKGLYHDAYNGELLSANRKAYQARAELDIAKKEIEHARQMERRAKRQAAKKAALAKAALTPEDVLTFAETQRTQPPQPVAAAPRHDPRQHADAVIQLSENLSQLNIAKGANQ